MKKVFMVFLVWFSSQYAEDIGSLEVLARGQSIVIATKRIVLEDFPDAFNPSIFKVEGGYLFSFRYVPQRDYEEAHTSYIGIVMLNDDFEPISKPQLLNTRQKNSKTLSQAEDARLFSYREKIFLIYNDNVDKTAPTLSDRRDMYMAELVYEKNRFILMPPLKLVCLERSDRWNRSWVPTWEKNWAPFEYDKNLLFVYMIDPHEVLYPNLITGECFHSYETYGVLDWAFGSLKGGTPAVLVDGEYLAFFHSGIVATTEVSWGFDLWHYFMGAYTFSDKPPFTITKFTTLPIIGEGFYTQSWHYKRVVFPGSFVDSGSFIYLAYGKDDYEMWIATLDKAELKKALQPVKAIK